MPQHGRTDNSSAGDDQDARLLAEAARELVQRHGPGGLSVVEQVIAQAGGDAGRLAAARDLACARSAQQRSWVLVCEVLRDAHARTAVLAAEPR